MAILVLASLSTLSDESTVLRLLDGACSVLGPRESIEIVALGTFGREARGKTETVCAALVKMADDSLVGFAQARDLESVFKTMLSASHVADCDVRVLATLPEQPTGAATVRATAGAPNS